MVQQHLEHRFAVNAEQFWQTFLLDADFQRALYDRLKLHIDYRQVEHSGRGAELVVRRELHFTPDRQLPAVLSRLLRGATLVKERSSFDARAGSMEITIELPVIGRITDFRGRYTWQEPQPGQLQRFWQADCQVHVPLIGSQIEKYLLGEVRQSLEVGCSVINEWFRARS